MSNIEQYFEHSPTVFIKWENKENYPVKYVTGNVNKIFDATADDFCTSRIQYHELIHPEDMEKAKSELEVASEQGLEEYHHSPYRVKNKDGWLWVDDFTKIIRDENNNIIEFYGYISDVSNFLNLQEKLSLMTRSHQQIYQALEMNYLISRSDLEGNITYVNQKMCEMTGYTCEELRGKPHSIFRHVSMKNDLFQELWKTIEEKKVWQGSMRNSTKDGTSIYVDCTIVPRLSANGDIEEYMAIRHNITDMVLERIQYEKNLKTSMSFKIPNRSALIEHIGERKNIQTAIIDINAFHEINDFYGYDKGDEILREFVKTVQSELDDRFKLFHLQSDQFVILTEAGELKNFEQYMLKLQSLLHEKTFNQEGCKISIRVTMALSNEKVETNMRSLDMGIQYAKNNKIPYVVYSEIFDLTSQYEQNILWIHKLKKAFNENRVVPFYQPIYSFATGNIERHECLARLIDDNGDIVTPDVFLNIVYKTNQINRLTYVMIENTFAYFDKSSCAFSINITVTDILNTQFLHYLTDKIEDFPYPEQITLEILESEGIENFDEVSDFIKSVKALGCKIAIDDFGSGYSNFENLLKLDVDIIKIDGSLIQDIHTNNDAYDIVGSIVTLARKKGIKTVAEFVSNIEIFKRIEELGIDYAQGYYIGKPSPTISAESKNFLNHSI